MALKIMRLLLLLILLTALSACSSPAANITAGTIDIRTVVTRDFGQSVLSDKPLNLPEKSNALDALKRVAQVETAYGRGFVKGIDGIRSEYKNPASAKKDWFVTINGMLANTGALDYTLYAGDIEQWDFHPWSFQQAVPAIIGHFPHPFEQGYAGKSRPTQIVYGEEFEDEAVSLKKCFSDSGVHSVILTAISGLAEKEKQDGNIILIALPDNGLIREINQNWKRLGFFAYCENGSIVTLTAEGKIKEKYGAGTGWIQATQNPWNPNGIGADENVVWLVTGIDQAGVKAAVDSLINHYEAIKYACAVIVAGGEVIRLPR